MSLKNMLGKKLIVFDGAMGTMLQKYDENGTGLSELYNINSPKIVERIHSEYLMAGCDIITANTFGANKLKLKNSAYSVYDIIKSGIEIAKNSIKSLKLKNKFVAIDIGSIGQLLKPLGNVSFDEAYEIFSEMVICGEKSGADLILIETMSDIYEAKVAILAAKENTSLPIFATMTLDEKGKTLTGTDIKSMVAVFEGLGVDCLGINCGLGPNQVKKLLNELLKYSSIPIMVQPNAGLPIIKNDEVFYDISPEEFGKIMAELKDMGVSVIGGCCGTTPLHIKNTIELFKDKTIKKTTKKNDTIICSYSKSIEIGKKPIIVGERINPTGKSYLINALYNKDFYYIVDEALSQKDAGADIIDLNVGMPEIDEPFMMKNAVLEIQAISNIPIQIDSSNYEAIEKAARIYNGKPLINSVNGKKEVMEKIFPIVKKYGGAVVGLTLDENGIPNTPEERLNIAKKIINTAKEYGIDKKDIIIDTLVLSVCTKEDEAKITLDSLKLVKEKLGVKTILGISNISFGLPKREILNEIFLICALNVGLDLMIIDPLDKKMMDSVYAYNAICGLDESFLNYIAYVK